MRWFKFAALILVVTFLQADMVAVIAVKNIKPNLLLILLVFFSIYCDTVEAIIISFGIGFAADLIINAMGPQTISFGLFGTLLAYLNHTIAIRKFPHQMTAILVVGILTAILAYLLSFLKNREITLDAYSVFLTSLYSGIIGPFLFVPAAWLMGIKTKRFSR